MMYILKHLDLLDYKPDPGLDLYVDDPTCVGCWFFNEQGGNTVYDISQYGNGGSLINSPTWVGGKFGSAIDFPGTNEYVNVASSGAPTGTNVASTRSFWMYQRTRTNGVNSAVLDQIKATHSFTIQLATVSGTTYLFTDSTQVPNNITLTGAEIPSLNAWHFILFSVDSSKNWNYYLDGGLIKSGTFANDITLGSNALDIGRRSSVVTAYFDGLIDNVRIYKRALSEAEIAELYNNINYQIKTYSPVSYFVAAAAVGNPWYYYAQM